MTLSEENQAPSGRPEVQVQFNVTARSETHCRPWENMYVVGNLPELGSWDPYQASQLRLDPQATTQDNCSCYSLKVSVTKTSEHPLIEYRYFVAQLLDSPTRKLVIRRWECSKRNRHRSYEKRKLDDNQPGCVLIDDTFGSLCGIVDHNASLDSGWLMHQSEVRLRLHGKALELFKAKDKQRRYRIKVTPLDVRYKEVFRFDAVDRRTPDKKPVAPAPAAAAGGGWRQMSLWEPEPEAPGMLDDATDDEDSRCGPPEVPAYTPTTIAVLNDESDASFHDQQKQGRMFICDQDFFVFRTQTVSVDNLAFLIDIYFDPRQQLARASDTGSESSNNGVDRGVERIGFCYLIMSSVKGTFGAQTVSITSLKHHPIGKISIDYLIVHPLSNYQSRHHDMRMDKTWARHWTKRQSLNVGHRGMGSSYRKFAMVRENTVESLNSAAKHGADYVEFDVQLTKDRHVVIYHDFHVDIHILRREGSVHNLHAASQAENQPMSGFGVHTLAVKDLKLKQLRLLKLQHSEREHQGVQEQIAADLEEEETQDDGEPINENSAQQPPPEPVAERVRSNSVSDRSGHRKWDLTSGDGEEPDSQPFPTLKNVLLKVDQNVGMNIEVKYPMLQANGEWECDNYWERNEYVDAILHVVMKYRGSRRVLFSSFDPDICCMLKLKQNKLPVLLLVMGPSTKYIPFLDQRSSTVQLAVMYAYATKLLGVNFHAEDLLKDAAAFQLAQRLRLVSFVWGDDLDNKDNIRHFKNLGVDGIIYDKVNEGVSDSKNVFLVEREQKEALLRSRSVSPSPNRLHP